MSHCFEQLGFAAQPIGHEPVGRVGHEALCRVVTNSREGIPSMVEDIVLAKKAAPREVGTLISNPLTRSYGQAIERVENKSTLIEDFDLARKGWDEIVKKIR